jgi:hypothetical protein
VSGSRGTFLHARRNKASVSWNSVTAQDKKNPSQVREQNRVRSSLGSEPSGSYSYHDESRLDGTRTPGRPPANDTQTARPGERVSKGTMLGGFADPAMTERAAKLLAAATSSSRRPLSEPPEIGSWPPLPNVPSELIQESEHGQTSSSDPELATLPGAPWIEDDEDLAPTDPPRPSLTSMSGGAIWEAVAPVLGQTSAPPRGESEPPPPAQHFVANAKPEKPAVEAVDATLRAEPEHASAQDTSSSMESHTAADRIGERMSTTELDYRDREVAKLEQLVERGAWDQLVHEIDPAQVKDSPTVALLQVIAKRELLPANEKGSSKLNHDAIQALAMLLGVPPSSPLALLFAKRLLRRNPVWSAKQPATSLSISIVLGGLAAGIGIGWLVTRMML